MSLSGVTALASELQLLIALEKDARALLEAIDGGVYADVTQNARMLRRTLDWLDKERPKVPELAIAAEARQ